MSLHAPSGVSTRVRLSSSARRRRVRRVIISWVVCAAPRAAFPFPWLTTRQDSWAQVPGRFLRGRRSRWALRAAGPVPPSTGRPGGNRCRLHRWWSSPGAVPPRVRRSREPLRRSVHRRESALCARASVPWGRRLPRGTRRSRCRGWSRWCPPPLPLRPGCCAAPGVWHRSGCAVTGACSCSRRGRRSCNVPAACAKAGAAAAGGPPGEPWRHPSCRPAVPAGQRRQGAAATVPRGCRALPGSVVAVAWRPAPLGAAVAVHCRRHRRVRPAFRGRSPGGVPGRSLLGCRRRGSSVVSLRLAAVYRCCPRSFPGHCRCCPRSPPPGRRDAGQWFHSCRPLPAGDRSPRRSCPWTGPGSWCHRVAWGRRPPAAGWWRSRRRDSSGRPGGAGVGRSGRAHNGAPRGRAWTGSAPGWGSRCTRGCSRTSSHPCRWWGTTRDRLPPWAGASPGRRGRACPGSAGCARRPVWFRSLSDPWVRRLGFAVAGGSRQPL